MMPLILPVADDDPADLGLDPVMAFAERLDALLDVRRGVGDGGDCSFRRHGFSVPSAISPSAASPSVASFVAVSRIIRK